MSRPRARLLVMSLLSSVAAACTTPVAAPVETAAVAEPAPTMPDFDLSRLNRDIEALASDAMEGRGTATPGEDKAVAYIVAQMHAAGLEPAGEVKNGVRQYTQTVPLQRSTLVGEPTLTLTTAGKKSALVLDRDMTVRGPLNGTPAIDIRNADLVFVGYGAFAPERQWDDYKGVDLKGKVAVVLVNDPDFEGPIADGGPEFDGKAMLYYGRWRYKYEEVARRGAAGVLVVHEDAPASYGWRVVADSRESVFDIVSATPDKDHSSLEGWMSHEMADRILKASGMDYASAKAMARRRDFRPVTLAPKLSVQAKAEVKTVATRNIAGMVRGAVHPDETVIYSGHFDHLGKGKANAAGDTISNGALDNASGTAAILEEGRAFASGPRPDRSVVILAVGAEEMGLLGSRYYASNPLFPLATTAGVLNMDMFMPFGRAKDFGIAGSAKLGLLDMLVEEAGRQGRTLSPDARPEAGIFYRSDHFSFAKLGVPAVSIESGLDLREGGLARGEKMRAAVNEKIYHTQEDEYDPAFDWSGLKEDMALMYAVGRRLAFSREWPNWAEGSEFKALRDASAAMRK